MARITGYILALFIFLFVAQAHAQNYYVDLYTHPYQKGSKYSVPIYKDVKDLNAISIGGGQDINDKISSAVYNIPKDWEVILWQDAYFQGRHRVLKLKGRVDNMRDKSFDFDDTVTSVQWRSIRPDTMGSLGTNRCLLRFFEDPGKKGRVLTINCNQDVGDLRYISTDDGRKGFDNMASAVEYNIPDGVKVELYQDKHFGSLLLMELSGSGRIPALPSNVKDRISSIKWVNY